MKTINYLVTAVLLFSLFSCEIFDNEDKINADEEITVGDPFFTIDPGSEVNNIFRVAWTGEKLWAITDLNGSSLTSQYLIEINPTNGTIVQKLTPGKPMWTLDYANGKLWDINTFIEKAVNTFDIKTGAYIGKWSYNGQYELYYNFTFDGTNYWGSTNFDCDGSNCQAYVSYNQNGDVVSADDDMQYADVVYGGGYFWATDLFQGYIYKLNNDFTVERTFKIKDFGKFGKTNYANELAMHIEYIDSRIWIIDRYNNFYKTSIK